MTDNEWHIHGTFTGTTAGTAITATLNGQAVTSTAPTVTVVEQPTRPSYCRVAPTRSSRAARTVTLTAKDANGAQPPPGLSVVFGLGNGPPRHFSTVTDNSNGTYTATFTGTSAD